MSNEKQDGKILVTGGLGAIGINLTQALVDNDRDVIVYDCKNNNGFSKIAPGSKIVNGDVRDSQKLSQLLKSENISGIVHLAAISQVGAAENDPALCASVNIGGTLSLIKAISAAGITPWFINCSSREVYGNPQNLPVPESYPLEPINKYGLTKVIGENIVSRYSKVLGLNAITFRPSNIYGSVNDIPDRMIPRFINNAIAGSPIQVYGGEQVLDLLHISDAVDGILRGITYLERMKCSGYYDAFNLATGTPHTIQEVIHLISLQTCSDLDIVNLEPRLFDVQHYVGDPKKAREVLGFKARMELEEGIPATVSQYRRTAMSSHIEKIPDMRHIDEIAGLKELVS